MKRILFQIILLGVFIVPMIALAEIEPEWDGSYRLEPGLYEIGIDIPEGHYDVRFKGLDQSCTIQYSLLLDYMNEPDMTCFYSYSFTYEADKWWQAVYPIIYVLDGGYLKINQSCCSLYPEK